MHILLNAQTWLFLTLCSFFYIPALASEDLLIFPEIRALDTNGDSSKEPDTAASVDLFATAQYGKLRLLGEIFISENDVAAERLQIGYEFVPDNSIWLGRFHNPIGYWNIQYHHGNYLQTSISRPEIAKLEHNGGLFPSHLFGVLLETTQYTGNGAQDYTFAAGTSPELRPVLNKQGLSGLVLHPLEIANPGKGRHKLNLTARFAYRPDTTENTQIGLFATHVEIAISGSSADAVALSTAGLFAHWEMQNLTINSSLFFTRDTVESGASRSSGSFSSGYLQLDYLFNNHWTLFARAEDTVSENADPYLNLMQNFSARGQVAGLRWDFTRRQALKLEVSQKDRAGKTFITTGLNWTAMFP